MDEPLMFLQVCFSLLSENMVLFTTNNIGSGAAEGFHNRLEQSMPRKILALDHMVDFLANEDKYWQRTLNDPRLWNEKKSDRDSAQEQHKRKRTTLKNYVDRSTKSDSSSMVTIASDGEDDGLILGTVDPLVLSLSTSSGKPPEKKRRRTRKLLQPHEVCPKCNENKRHQDCNLGFCKWCCCDSTERCTLTDHNRSNVGARKPFHDVTNATNNISTTTELPYPSQILRNK